jgi:glycosyltransferase involved in cell wall biosynthesis
MGFYMKNVILVFANYGPYHFARLNAFHTACKQLGWNAVGLEFSRTEQLYPWRVDLQNLPYNFITLDPEKMVEEIGKFKLIKKLFKTLNQHQPNVLVIAGYSPFAMLATMVWGRLHTIPVILMTDSKEDDSRRHFLIEELKKNIIRCYQAALVAGSPQKRYLMKLGMSSKKIFTGYDVVDNQFFHQIKTREFKNPISKPFFLVVSRFVKKKNLRRLIEAYAIYYHRSGPDAWDLVLCGDGELRRDIENQILNLNLESCVHLTGFLQSSEQLPYFSNAKCFIHASTQEQWGLVVNEAMASGLPVLISRKCGCFEDLVLEGKNGFGFDPEDTIELANLLIKMSSGEVNLSEFAEVSLNHIQNFSPRIFAKNLVKAIQCC